MTKLITQNELSRQYWMEEANRLGITFARNIKTEDLMNKVKVAILEEKLKKLENNSSTPEFADLQKNDMISDNTVRIIDDATKLVRVMITPADPHYIQLGGTVRSCGNEFIGVYRYAIPFGIEAYLPKMIVDQIAVEKYTFRPMDNQFTKTLGMNQKALHAIQYKPRFKIDELPDLTPKQIEELARQQSLRDTNMDSTSTTY